MRGGGNVKNPRRGRRRGRVLQTAGIPPARRQPALRPAQGSPAGPSHRRGGHSEGGGNRRPEETNGDQALARLRSNLERNLLAGLCHLTVAASFLHLRVSLVALQLPGPILNARRPIAANKVVDKGPDP